MKNKTHHQFGFFLPDISTVFLNVTYSCNGIKYKNTIDEIKDSKLKIESKENKIM